MMRTAVVFVLCLGLAVASLASPATAADPAALGFSPAGKEFRFDTGPLRGTLRPQGRSLGLMPVTDGSSGATISGAFGFFSHYRLLDSEARYGHAAWDWASAARRLPDGAVEAIWTGDQEHPFDLRAVYRWKKAGTLDVATTVTPRKDLRRFEVFLASYCSGFPESLVYVQGCPETGGRPGLLAAKKAAGDWQMFPRDDAAVQIIQDGRWRRPPNPVDWKMMPRLAGPLAVRRDAKTGLAIVFMAPPGECFAVSTPYGEEGHRSVYLSLLGRNLKSGQPATARARLVIARDLTDQRAIELYEAYRKEINDPPAY